MWFLALITLPAGIIGERKLLAFLSLIMIMYIKNESYPPILKQSIVEVYGILRKSENRKELK
jgi:hypothetical protein